MFDTVIVGAGAAGLATAIFAARRDPGCRVLVLDGARRIGAKILVSGGGRCNVTNRVVTASDFNGGDRRIIASILQAFPSPAAAEFFRGIGVPLHEEEDGKLFPDSNRARTVLDALLAEAERLGVSIACERRAESLRRAGEEFAVGSGAEDIAARRVVLATGGRSLPKTGSDGAGLQLAASLGHSIVPTTPALAPLLLEGDFHRRLAGVAHQAAITIESSGRMVARVAGSLLWTHFGISGPAALDASRHWHRAALDGAVRTFVSFAPGLDAAAVERRLLDASVAHPASMPRTALAAWLPAAVADAILETLDGDRAQRLGQLSRDGRRRLARALVNWELRVTGSRGYNYAEATAGGVALGEIHRGTMASRRCPGLYLVGEMLDVDGRLGGFNFQWAWSSAWVAARALTAPPITKSVNQPIQSTNSINQFNQPITKSRDHQMTDVTVGFIGLGLMGRPMALNLLKAGYPLVVHSRSRGPVEALAEAGARVGKGPADVAAQCGVVITMVPDSPDVEQVLAGPGGVFEGMRPGTVLVDMSSISPVVTRRLAAAASERGATLLDAPVSGGEIGAINGTLSIMVGGDAAAVERVRPLFDVMGNPERVIHVGESGAGQICKVCNQMAIGGALAVVSELIALARKAGVDPAKVRQALLGGFAASRVLEVHGERILNGNYKPGFKAALYDKDMGIALQTARTNGVPVPVTAVVAQLVNGLVAAGKGDADYSALATVLFDLAGLDY